MKAKYAILVEALRENIINGTFQQGQRLNTELELAQLYGLSRQTVRKALDILEEEQYIHRKRGSGTYVNHVSSTEKQVMRIGVVVTNISDFIFPAILRGIDAVLSKNNYSMVLKTTHNRFDNERVILQNFLQDPVDGLIIEATKTSLPNPNIELYRKLIAAKVPIVFINSYPRQLEDPTYVMMDDAAGGLLAVQYLHQHGHKCIAGIFKSDDMQGVGRFSGFIDGIAQYEMPFSDDLVIWYTTETRRCMLDHLYNVIQQEPIASASAIVCYNDEIALHTIEALHANDRSPSKTVVCFDQIVHSEIFQGKIVALKHPKEVMGNKAASMLLDIIQGNPKESFVFNWEYDI